MNEEETINPWTTLNTRMIYSNNWISVQEDSVIRPDGEPGIYGVVRFRNAAMGIIALTEDDEIYLVGQYRYALGHYSWEIPEGGGTETETPLEAAQRELAEETGLVAANWQLLGQAHLSNCVSDEKAFWFLATKLQAGKANPEGTERLTVKKVAFDTALSMVLDGTITDALSVLAIQSYALRRSRAGAAR